MFDLDGATLFWSLVFSIIGLGYFSYGRKQNLYYLLAGMGLLIFPFFVSQFWWMMLIGIGLVVLPFLLNRFFPW